MAQFFKPKAHSNARSTAKLTLDILRWDHQGRGIAQHQGKPVFVSGAIAGEQVVAQLQQQKKEFATAQALSILSPSPQRQTPSCQHYQICGGCDLQHLSYPSQLDYKAESLLGLIAKFAKVTDIELAPTLYCDEFGYRRTARFGLQYHKKQRHLQMSFRRKGSNDLFEQKVCPVLGPQLEALIGPVYQALTQLSIVAGLGHVSFYLAEQGPAILLRHLKPLTKKDYKILEALSIAHQAIIFLQGNDNQVQQLLTSSETGNLPVTLRYGLIPWQQAIEFAPNNFIQVNAKVNLKMIEQALAWLDIQQDDKVLDLFCGLGNFSLPIATQAAQVVGVEGVASMVEQAKGNAQRAGLSNAAFYQADLSQDFSQQPWAKQTFNKALLDPARDGALFVTEHLVKLNCQRIVYVSCNPATLARDAKSLLDRGYRLAKLGLIDMFPQTAHMESMALFVRDTKK
ncbi:23S rRNA (uracil(1939)-C(5))-methyltransferase RlmD [Motilimonas eburnea]|uniref:23S rRNA (uracil(1939)-C(5))-methyltransferase RlmD n=1 Tax=Motilimonas eburnea TaxID=1737488 RepID=UPI001E5D85B7|nr:23S rRNA (uracil(1939)-C(5))-methyltransferase RlmD [Motilimonas eburnea]MCE2571430.1 23S rRNA (uracil(1939)-C(5))-methyltransferase RlmD [Motilimonas eburnea]